MTVATQPGAGPIAERQALPWLVCVPLRLGLLVALLVLSYHYSLESLIKDWDYQAPLADLALVPPVALGLLVAATLRHQSVGIMRLGRADLVIGGAGLLIAAASMLLAPVVLTNYYWAFRPDLLSLPIATVAVVALLFGVRTVIPFAFPLAYLMLAWPLPHAVMLEHAQRWLTTLTTGALRLLIGVVPVARVEAGGPDLRLFVPHVPGFTVGVASACSGTGSLLGFSLIGLAALYLIDGPLRRRFAWLAVGALAIWVTNLLRVLAILAAGRLFGQSFALGVLHPLAGIVMVNLTFALLVIGLPRFGLTRRPLRAATPSDTPLTEPAPPEQRPTPRQLLPRLAVLAVVAAVLAVANGQLAIASVGFEHAMQPVSATFDAQPRVGASWMAERLGQIDDARTYFGSTATWTRYRLTPLAGATAAPPQPFTVWVDSIVTSDLSALAAHPVLGCYRLHGFKVLTAQRVTMVAGLIGELLAYRLPDGDVWHALSWEWPVRNPDGGILQERMTLLASSDLRAASPLPGSVGQGLRAPVLSAFNSLAPNHDPNPTLSRALLQVGAGIVASRTDLSREG
ncbi:MAG TPA: exosortase/archaeosortase family protein [Actinomycetota bacterium]